MDKLFKMLERGEMPSFLEVLQALNEVSDIDWDRVEASQLPFPEVLTACRVSKHPCPDSGQSCQAC